QAFDRHSSESMPPPTAGAIPTAWGAEDDEAHVPLPSHASLQNSILGQYGSNGPCMGLGPPSYTQGQSASRDNGARAFQAPPQGSWMTPGSQAGPQRGPTNQIRDSLTGSLQGARRSRDEGGSRAASREPSPKTSAADRYPQRGESPQRGDRYKGGVPAELRRTPQFVTGPFTPHHCFLEDREYGRALDSLVKAVSDILVTSSDESRVFLGRRKVEPQPDWWYIGGRAKPGETTQEAAARNVRRELGLELPARRFEVLANYSFVWHMRAQEPADHGTADISTVHRLTLLPEEEAAVKLDEQEYEDARWFACEEVLAGEFHPALKQAIWDLRAKSAYEALAQ
ncbi:unnamed protein product, partial [Polarella glacialis]